ncbi:hypothetical protein G3545_00585 [Starkeya sp. ORNL1]|uniref:hypothetical protein n=1 Tax=Starkeya sp. ORNL1 TaxID=2709380 RepID=UPI0014629969|nr:hypothetical protein [Starkeya sp. ORNL1]QJP12285.1 hypothetical protein G3545_00585 [Starkeya sp. ORNL1]
MSGEAKITRDEITDEMLMAYVDGELPPEIAAAVEHAAAEPGIARRIDGYRRSRTATRDAFATLLDAPPPERLLAAILPARRPAWRSRAALPLAAALALVLGLGSYWVGRLSAPETLTGVAGSPAVATALGRQPSGAPLGIGPAQLVLSGTYLIKDGLCRSFTLTSESEALRGVGCDHGRGWRTELLVAATVETAPASGSAAELVEGFLESAGAGAALTPDAEAQHLKGD